MGELLLPNHWDKGLVNPGNYAWHDEKPPSERRYRDSSLMLLAICNLVNYNRLAFVWFFDKNVDAMHFGDEENWKKYIKTGFAEALKEMEQKKFNPNQIGSMLARLDQAGQQFHLN